MPQFRPWLAAATLALAGLPALATTPMPVRPLTLPEVRSLSAKPYLSPANQPFSMAAASKVRAFNRPELSQVQRSAGGTAAVYTGAPQTTVPMAPPLPDPVYFLNFIGNGDLAQSWATMTADGVPYISALGFGDFAIDATASWNTTLAVPADGNGRELVLRFVVPAAIVGGASEGEGPALWQSRLRTELLVNGFPAWSSEAMRYTLNPQQAGFSNPPEIIVLNQFGSPMPFATDDEDLSTTNNSSQGNTNTAAPRRVVYLSLGRFAGGATVDLSMILRATASTAPVTAGGTDNRCVYDAVDGYFCSNSKLSVDGSTGEAPRIYLLP